MSDEHVDVGYHIDKAQYYLELVGEPESRQEMFLAAQAHALLGFVLTMRGEPAASTSLVPDPPQALMHVIGVGHLAKPEDLTLAMRKVHVAVPDWDNKKIQAIKELRGETSLGLKEAKDVIDWTLSMGWAGGKYWFD